MSALSLFEYNGQTVRVVLVDDEPRFVVADLARILGYRDAANASRVLRDHHKGYSPVSTPGGTQDMLVATEAGMNRLVLRANTPAAESVQDWITDDVLPEIRKTGSYTTPEDPTQFFARAVLMAQQTIEAKDAVILELAPRAEAYDRLAGSSNLIKVEVAARKAGIGRTTAFALLRRHGIFTVYGNTPLAAYAHRFEEVPATHINSRGEEVTTFTTKVRPDSLDWLVSTLLRIKAKEVA